MGPEAFAGEPVTHVEADRIRRSRPRGQQRVSPGDEDDVGGSGAGHDAGVEGAVARGRVAEGGGREELLSVTEIPISEARRAGRAALGERY